jgi:thiamine-phosphate pyrophosphorylase
MQEPSKNIDVRVYALLDPERAGSRSLSEIASLIGSSVTLVQLRDKHGGTRVMVEEARAIRAALAPSRVPLLVNDRVDVALAAKAGGVHIGQDDIDAADARRLLGRNAIIGLSLKTAAQANALPVQHVDYVAIGGVFATQSKDNPDPPIGLGGFKSILAAVRARAPDMPVTAIAGIDAGNAADVIAAGADGVAMISALSLANDPAQAAHDLRKIVDGALSRRSGR